MIKISIWQLLLVAASVVLASPLAPTAQAQHLSFVARRDFAAGAVPAFIAVTDFNLDGKLDAVVTNDGEAGVSDPGVSVLLGNGDGSF